MPDIKTVTPDFRKIRVVAIDAVGTLIEPVPAIGVAYHRIASRHGSRLSLEEITLRFRQAFTATESRPDLFTQTGLDPWWTSEEEEYQRWQRIVEMVITDVPEPLGCFEEIHQHFALPSAWRAFPDVSPALSGLKKCGLNLVVASNFDNRLHSVQRGLPELNDLENSFISSELGVRKPSAEFFRRMVERLDCTPEQVLMVGDDWENDVVAPVSVGLPAIWLNRNQKASANPSIHSLTDLLTFFSRD